MGVHEHGCTQSVLEGAPTRTCAHTGTGTRPTVISSPTYSRPSEAECRAARVQGDGAPPGPGMAGDPLDMSRIVELLAGVET